MFFISCVGAVYRIAEAKITGRQPDEIGLPSLPSLVAGWGHCAGEFVTGVVKSLPTLALGFLGFPEQEEQLFQMRDATMTAVARNIETNVSVIEDSQPLMEALNSMKPEAIRYVLGEAIFDTMLIVAPLAKGPKPGLGKPPTLTKKSYLLVGPERTSEFIVEGKGIDVTAVNPLKTIAAEQFEQQGGHFIKSQVQDLPSSQTFTHVHENFPQPLGETKAALDACKYRFERAESILTTITEDQTLLEMYKEEAILRGMSVEIQSIPPSSVELPSYIKDAVLEGKVKAIYDFKAQYPTSN